MSLPATTISPYALLRDVVTDQILATIDERDIFDYKLTFTLDKPGTFMHEVAWGSDYARLLVAAAGTLGAPAAHPAMIEFSLDGGLNFDTRKMAEDPIPVLENGVARLSEQGDDLFTGYWSETGQDRATFGQVRLQDALYGAPGTIPVVTDSARNSLFVAGITLPSVKGIFQTIPGLPTWAGRNRMAFVPVVDRAIRDLILDLDDDEDYIGQSLINLLHAAQGIWLPGDAAPPGTRFHFCADPGDAALNAAGVDRGVAIGVVGTAPVATFTRPKVVDGVPTNERTMIATLGISQDPRGSRRKAKTLFRGGRSDNGLPDGAKFTGAEAITAGGGGGAWNAALLVNSIACADGNGGVYYLGPDDIWHPIGNAGFACNAVAYEPTRFRIYAATRKGVVTHSANVLDTSPWVAVGKIATDVDDVWLDGTTVLCRLTAQGAGYDGVYCSPVQAGADNTGMHYDGWSSFGSFPGLTDAAGAIAQLLVVDKSTPDTVHIHPTPFAHGQPAKARTNSGAWITRLCHGRGNGNTYVLTQEGALGVYRIPDGGTALLAINGDGSLVDRDRKAVTVNNIVPCAAGTILGRPVALIACTDQGLFYSPSPAGNGWRQATNQSPVQDANLTLAAAGGAVTRLGRPCDLVWGLNADACWGSASGGIWARKLKGKQLDKGPFWHALAQEAGQRPWADSTISGLGTAPAGVDTGTSGTTIPIPSGSKRRLPPGYLWLRVLNSQNDWVYKGENLGSTAAYAGIEFAELSEISTSTLIGAVTASEGLALAEYRWGQETSITQIKLQVTGRFTRADAAGRRIRPQQMVALDFSGSITNAVETMYASYSGQQLLVLEHEISKSQTGNAALTKTTLSNLLRTEPVTTREVQQSIEYGLFRLKRSLRG